MTITKTILGTILLGSIISYQHADYSRFDGSRKVAAESNSSLISSQQIHSESESEIDLLSEAPIVETAVSEVTEDLVSEDIVILIDSTSNDIASNNLAKSSSANYEKIICQNNQKINALEKSISNTNTQLSEVLTLLKSKDSSVNSKKESLADNSENKNQYENELKDNLLELYLASQSSFSPMLANNIFQENQPSFMSQFNSFQSRQDLYSPSEFFRLSFLSNSNLTTNFNSSTMSSPFQNRDNRGKTFIYAPNTTYQSYSSRMPINGQSFLDSGFYGDNSLAQYGLHPQIKIPTFSRNNSPLRGSFDFKRNI